MPELLLAGRYRVTQVKIPETTYLASDTYRPGYPICVVRRLQFVNPSVLTLQTTQLRLQKKLMALTHLKPADSIVPFVSFFEENQKLYVVEEFIPGYALSRELMPGQPLNADSVVRILNEVLTALAVLHEQGILHENLSPTSIIRRKSDGKLVLINLLLGGTLRFQGEYSQGWIVQSSETAGNSGTAGDRPSSTASTEWPYQPPEQLQGRPVLSSDLYALGILAIQALTGIAPPALNYLRPATTTSSPASSSPITITPASTFASLSSSAFSSASSVPASNAAATSPPASNWHQGLSLPSRLIEWLNRLTHPDWTQRPRSATEALRSLQHFAAASSGSMPPLPPPPHFAGEPSVASPPLISPDHSPASPEIVLSCIRQGAAGPPTLSSPPAASPQSGKKSAHPAAFTRSMRRRAVWKRRVLQVGLGCGLIALGYLLGRRLSPVASTAPARPPAPSVQRTLLDYTRTLQQFPQDGTTYLRRGDLRLQLGDPTGAIADYNQAIALLPPSPQPLIQRGRAYQMLGDSVRALADFDQAIRLAPGRPESYLHRCAAHTDMNNLTQALQDCTTALNLNPSLEAAYQNRSLVQRQGQNWRAAIADLNAAIALNPNSARSHRLRGEVRLQWGDRSGALQDFERAIALAPSDGLSYYNRALLRLSSATAVSPSDQQAIQQDLQTAAQFCLNQRDFDCYQNAQKQLQTLPPDTQK